MRSLAAAMPAGVMCLVAVGASAGAPRTYEVFALQQAAVLDGKLDEAAWRRVPEATGFYVLGGREFALCKQTFFRAGWTDDSLYLAVRCFEPDPGKMNASGGDEGQLWLDDSVELFFKPHDSDEYFHLAANSVGARWNGVGMGNPRPLWAWGAKAQVGPDNWSLEARIPFSVLKRTPSEGETWRVSVARNINTGPAFEHFTCWPPLGRSFHEPTNFAVFVFRKRVLAPEDVRGIEEHLNRPYRELLRKEIGAYAAQADEYREVVRKALAESKLKKLAATLKPLWAAAASAAANRRLSARELSDVLGKCRRANLLEQSERLRDLFLLESLFKD